MKLHLTSAYTTHPGLDALLQSAELDCEGNHVLCKLPEDADAIVFVENTQFDDLMFSKLLSHDLVKNHWHKVFMFNEMDRPWSVLPGIYTCMPDKHFESGVHAAFAYLSTPNACVRDVHQQNHERQWLYSFMGAMSHTCRKRVMQLPDARGYLQNTSDFNVWNTSEQELHKRSRNYADVLSGSSYVLCPRGIGTSSIRLYEALEAGRAPVVIADRWVPPPETDWEFAVRIREDQISKIPDILQACEQEAIERGKAARNAWLQNYAPSTLFNTMGNAIDTLQSNGPVQARSRKAQLNKWIATGGLYKRTAIQKLRGQR